MTKQLPENVKSVGLFLKSEKNHELHEVACKLISDTEEHINMWLAIEKREKFTYDDLWVWSYLGLAAHFSKLPPYYFISNSDRKELSNRINRLTEELVKLYVDNELDFKIVAANGKILNGFYVLDDFSDKNRKGFENDQNVQKSDFVPILNGAAERAGRMIQEAQHNGKAGKNAKAVRLVRELYDHHIRKYDSPLNHVLLTVSNSIFETNFTESDIRKLLTRVGI